MKKTLFGFLISLFVAAAMNVGQGRCQDTPPAINVSVALVNSGGSATSSFGLNDAIGVVISLANAGTDQIAITKGFSAKKFHLELHFTYLRPDGKKELITAEYPENLNEPGPPRIKSILGTMLQVEFVEILETNWALAFEAFNALDFYRLDRTGKYTVKAVIPARTFPLSEVRSLSSNPYVPLGSASWEGDLESNPVSFTVSGDADGDDYCYPAPCSGTTSVDCDDTNSSVHPGAEEVLNNGIDDDCDPTTPDKADLLFGTVEVTVELHTVGPGSYPGASKQTLPGVPVNLYERLPGSCAASIGTSWQHYPTIWEQCNTPYLGSTGPDGTMSMQASPGDYLIIVKYDPDDFPDSGNEIYAGGNAAGLDSGETLTKRLKIMVKSNGKKVPAKYTQLTGSELLIIEPEYIEWDGTEELYPFLFESVGDWYVTTSVSPPEGFVADHESLSEDVSTELEAVQFTITDVGSEWKDTNVSYEVTHKEKKMKIKSKIGVKLSKELAKKKGLDEYGNRVKSK